MPIFSNIDDVGPWIEGVIKDMGFDIEDEDHGTLGHACADAVAGVIQVQGAFGVKPDGGEQPANRPAYNEWKSRHFEGERRTNFRTHQMLSKESLMGEVSVSHNTVEMGYGTGNPSPGEIRKDPIPDTMKAHYAEEQDRGFYELSDEAEDRVFDRVARGVAAHLQREADK